ncbi:AraC family transcriptional regulator [Nocardioides stalactiti]|uniref:AraC family transcriptional regulator n=1 Tax=Nocardioides stalactiti TaxID=2755356 RepID=UPI001603376D|nr:AraC family transcriptional regulator [Nocardioides stalactiti]
MPTLIRASNLWGFGTLVRELGGDPARLQSRFGIAPAAEQEEDAFVAFEPFVRMLEASAEELDCPDFGLRLSQWQGLDILGPIAVIARNAQTLQDGLGSVARYLYVHSPALTLAVEPQGRGRDLKFTYEVTELSLDVLRQGYELSMANGVQITRLLGGPDARPSAISFLHEQMGSDAAYAEVLGCEVRFGQAWCGFELPLGLAERAIDRADPQTRRIATKYLEANFLPHTTTLTERVAELARRLLPTGHCTADAIADQLNLHPRTLQRRLLEEGIRCQDVIDRERRHQAGRYLAEPGLGLSQIAGLLGYAEQSTFNRSCRRWFGKTPRQVRAGLDAGVS